MEEICYDLAESGEDECGAGTSAESKKAAPAAADSKAAPAAADTKDAPAAAGTKAAETEEKAAAPKSRRCSTNLNKPTAKAKSKCKATELDLQDGPATADQTHGQALVNRKKRPAPGELPATFARRYKPSSTTQCARWQAMRDVFYKCVKPRAVRRTSYLEAGFGLGSFYSQSHQFYSQSHLSTRSA